MLKTHFILLTLRIGGGYTGIYDGRQIYKSSYRPLFDAANFLLKRGLARPNDLIRLRFNNSDAYPLCLSVLPPRCTVNERARAAMRELDPFPRAPKTFLKFYPKTRTDLSKHLDKLHRLITDSNAACEMTSDELRMLCRDIQRAVSMLELAELVMQEMKDMRAPDGEPALTTDQTERREYIRRARAIRHISELSGDPAMSIRVCRSSAISRGSRIRLNS